MSPVKRTPGRKKMASPANELSPGPIVQAEKSQPPKQATAEQNRENELNDSRSSGVNEIEFQLVSTPALKKATKNKRQTNRSEEEPQIDDKLTEHVDPIQFGGSVAQKTENKKRVSKSAVPRKSYGARKSKVDDTDDTESFDNFANAEKDETPLPLNNPGIPPLKKEGGCEETAEICSDELSSGSKEDDSRSFDFENMQLGFVDLEGRCYMFEQAGEDFFDNQGRLYTVDKSKRGYFDEEGNHFVFDDRYLDEYKKTPETMHLLETFIDTNQKLDVTGAPVGHPIKRRLIVFANDLLWNHEAANDELGDAEIDEDTLNDDKMATLVIDEFPRSSVSKSKKDKSARAKLGKEQIHSSEPSALDANVDETKIFEDVGKIGDLSDDQPPSFVAVKPKTAKDKVPKVAAANNQGAKKKAEKELFPAETETSQLHRHLAKALIELGEDDLTEVFNYIDECGGGDGLDRLAALLENRKAVLSGEKIFDKISPQPMSSGDFASFDDSDDDDEFQKATAPRLKNTPKKSPNRQSKLESHSIQFSFQQPPAENGCPKSPKVFKKFSRTNC